MQKIPFAVGTTSARNKKANNETLVNLFAETLTPASKNSTALMGTPGFTTLLTLPTFPILGTHIFKEELYAVTPTKVYKISALNVATEIGTVVFDSTQRVFLANNGIQMVICQGDSYVYEPEAGTPFYILSDPDYLQSSMVDFQDGYFIWLKEDSGIFFISDLYSTDIDPLEFASAEGSPDKIEGLVVAHRQLWLFGTETTEVWYNSGAADFPFTRIQGSFSERGCINKDTIVKTNNTIAYVGDDRIVYIINGYTPSRISNEAIEYKLGQVEPSTLNAFQYAEEGHIFYCLVIGDESFVYDMKTQMWHTRKSTEINRWRINDIKEAYAIRYCFDYEDGRVYQLSLDIGTENSVVIQRLAISAPLNNSLGFFSVGSVQLDMETGISPIGEDDEITLEYSKDGGVSWSFKKSATIGKEGEFTHRAIWRRLGRHRDISFRIRTQTTANVRLIALYAGIK
jgi:hypothetical protein